MTPGNTLKRFFIIATILLVVAQAKFCTPGAERKKFSDTDSLRNDSLRRADLIEIKKRGRLIAITDNSSTGYFVYKGEPMGYEYELLSLYAKHLGVDLEVRITNNMDIILDQLNDGEADIAAANLTITSERSSIVNFSRPLMQTKQVLVQRVPQKKRKKGTKQKEKKLIREPSELEGAEIHVRKASSFYTRLQHLSEESGVKIIITEVPGNFETEELIGKVANGEIDYTVADENVALVNQTYYDNIDVKTALSLPQKIAWAVRKNSRILLEDLNCWIEENERGPAFGYIYARHFVDRKMAAQRRSRTDRTGRDGNISVYDHAIQVYSKKLGWDWRLMASLICQESRFNPEARSWAGAYGLMQLIPATSARYGIDSLTATPVQSIEAGTRYLMSLERFWKQHVKDSSERIKFVLASYNVGPGHVIDARNLASAHHFDPEKWEGNVEYCLLQKSKPAWYRDKVVKYGYCRGKEPSSYVRQILSRYHHYRNVIPENPYAADVSAVLPVRN